MYGTGFFFLKQHHAQSSQTLFICNVCSKEFSTKLQLIQHTKFHAGRTTYSCEICNKAFLQNSTLKTHMRTHTGDNILFSCKVCGKAFHRNVQLQRHSYWGEAVYMQSVQ